jgi:hypothetical protein
MDPEIIQDGPGTGPICGMALEPMDGVAEGPNPELIDVHPAMKKRLRGPKDHRGHNQEFQIKCEGFTKPCSNW